MRPHHPFHPMGMAVGLLLTLAGCATAQLQVPASFEATAQALPVTGHSPRHFNEPIRIGPYSALELSDGGTFGWQLPVGALDVGGRARDYAFTLVAIGQPPVEVQCRVASLALGYDDHHGRVESRTELDLTALSGPALGCGLHIDDGGEVSLLQLQRSGTRLDGRVGTPWGEATVHSVHALQGAVVDTYAPAGFEIVLDGAPVAMVDAVNAGRVLLAPRLDDGQRSYFAAVAAALLLLGEDAEA